jgi:hypothetical protein
MTTPEPLNPPVLAKVLPEGQPEYLAHFRYVERASEPVLLPVAGESPNIVLTLIPMTPTQPGSRLKDWRWLELVDLEPTPGGRCFIPSARPLWKILGDIVQHGIDYPKHGTGCACLDDFAYEIKAHISRVVPEIEYRLTELDPEEYHEPGDEWVEIPASRHARFDAAFRISHVLDMVRRSL